MNEEYIEIQKELIPYEFQIELEDQLFTFDVRYNNVHDFFTIDLLKDDELIVAGEKIVYGERLFATSYDPKTHPVTNIIALDPSGIEQKVTYENLGVTVFLLIEGEVDE